MNWQDRFPDFARADVRLANWRQAPWSRWAFQNVQEVVPSAVIAGNASSESGHSPALGGIDSGLEAFLVSSQTDSLLALKDGLPVLEWNAPHRDATKPHIVFSVSKSITALLAGALAGEGMLSADDPVARHVPEAAGSAYGDATLRDLLDMQVSLDFTEDYLDTTGGFERYRRATGWNPAQPGGDAPDLVEFLCSLKKKPGEHGHAHAYRSPNTDMLGIALERAGGARLHELLSEHLWRPMGAQSHAFVTVDRGGTARAAGGMSAAAHDLARIGELVRLDGKGVVPADWIADIVAGSDPAIWARGDQTRLFPKGNYRSCWYHTGEGEIAAIGIHGQWIWVDRARGVTLVKLSSQSLPVDETLDQAIVAALRSLAASL